MADHQTGQDPDRLAEPAGPVAPAAGEWRPTSEEQRMIARRLHQVLLVLVWSAARERLRTNVAGAMVQAEAVRADVADIQRDAGPNLLRGTPLAEWAAELATASSRFLAGEWTADAAAHDPQGYADALARWWEVEDRVNALVTPILEYRPGEPNWWADMPAPPDWP